jgi:hypothetical protein
MLRPLVMAVLCLLPGPMLVACSEAGTQTTRTASPFSPHEQMIEDMERTGAGGGGGGGM